MYLIRLGHPKPLQLEPGNQVVHRGTVLQEQAEKVVLLDRACQEDACQQGPAAACMHYVWQAGSRIIAGCLRSAESYAPFMDGMNKQKAAGSPREIVMMHYHGLVRNCHCAPPASCSRSQCSMPLQAEWPCARAPSMAWLACRPA